MNVPGSKTADRAGVCYRCKAPLHAGAHSCWLCGTSLDSRMRAEASGSESSSAALAAMEPVGSFSLASLMMFVTLACVVLGVLTLWPGVGIPLGIILLVVWSRTVAVAWHRQQRGLEVTQPEKVQLFLASFGAALALIAVTCVAGCAAFVAACFACAATMNVGGDAASMLVFAGVAAAIVIPTLWWVAKVIRRRWRRDIGERG